VPSSRQSLTRLGEKFTGPKAVSTAYLNSVRVDALEKSHGKGDYRHQTIDVKKRSEHRVGVQGSMTESEVILVRGWALAVQRGENHVAGISFKRLSAPRYKEVMDRFKAAPIIPRSASLSTNREGAAKETENLLTECGRTRRCSQRS